MFRLIVLSLFSVIVLAQPQAHIYVASNPSGACTARAVPQITMSTGAISTCANGTWSVTGTVSPTGTVTNVTGTAPIAVATGTTTPVISLLNTAVTPGAYTNMNATVDSKGRITAAANGSSTGGVASIIAGTGISVNAATGAVTVTNTSPGASPAGCPGAGTVELYLTSSTFGCDAQFYLDASWGALGTGFVQIGPASSTLDNSIKSASAPASLLVNFKGAIPNGVQYYGIGLQAQADITNAGSAQRIYQGFNIAAAIDATADAPGGAVGISSEIWSISSHNIGVLYGYYNFMGVQGTGVVAGIEQMLLDTPTLNGNPIPYMTGLHIWTGGDPSVTTSTGLLIEDVSGSPGANYAIHTGLGLNTFGDRLTAPAIWSTTNCADNAGVAACGSAAAGAFVIDAAATTVVVSTTAITADSQIFIQEDSSLSTRLSVTCNTQSSLTLGAGRVTARTSGASFTLTLEAAPTTNPACFNYWVVN